MTNPPENPAENPAGPPPPPDGRPGQQPPGTQPGPQPGPPPGPPPGAPQGPPPGQPGPPPGWQAPPPAQPVWQGHQAPQQSAYGWQPPHPPKKRRTGLIVGIVVAVLLLAGGGIAAAAVLLSGDSDVLAVSELEEDMCLSSDDLAEGSTEVDDMTETDCAGDHDAEVFAVLEVEAGETFEEAGSRCAEELGVEFHALREDGIEVRPLAETDEPAADDRVVCFLRNENGEPLTEELA